MKRHEQQTDRRENGMSVFANALNRFAQSLIAGFTLLMSAPLFSTAAEATPRPLLLSQAIDILDTATLGLEQMGYQENFLTREHLRERIKFAYDAGIRKIYFRATGGVVYYPDSKLRRTFKGMYPHQENGARTFKEYDILAECIRIAHELGMQIYYWEPVFDTYGECHFPAGTEENRKYGEYPFRDLSIRDEHHWEHRFATRPPENLKQPIRELKLRTRDVPKITAENLAIFTAPHNADFKPYTKPFQVAVKEVKNSDYKAEVTISGLEITEPCIKLMNRGDQFLCSIDAYDANSVSARYLSGAPVKLFTSCEFMLSGDPSPLLTRRGVGGFQYAWGGKNTFIIRFGDFTRYAIGVPDYAYQENRDRMKAIVSELYDRYPQLDGVTISIRTHSLPAGGSPAAVGTELIYGYSEPAVQEYLKRYGVNPRTSPFDENKFLKLRGEYFTQMLEEVAAVVHAKGGKLECMAPIRGAGSIAHGSMYPWWTKYNIDNYFDINTWAKKGIVDNVIMLGTQHRQKTWGKEWQGQVKLFADKLAGTQTRLTLHYLANHSPPPIMKQLLPEVLRQPGLDEVEFYEEFHMMRDKLYPALTEAVRESGRQIVK